MNVLSHSYTGNNGDSYGATGGNYGNTLLTNERHIRRFICSLCRLLFLLFPCLIMSISPHFRRAI